MNKIKFTANKDTNYVFHMLSVAKCGYNNEYGERYRGLYPKEDLEVLKSYESMITVCGGEHCGELYGLLAAQPACAYMPAKEYYAGLIQMIDNNEVPEESIKYIDTVRDISEIMIKYYDHYCDEIWKTEEQKITSYIPEVLEMFEKSDFTQKAEDLLGTILPTESFTAAMVSSVKGGAEAIDISNEQDVFGIDRASKDTFCFIGHEFIIYLLIEALKDEPAFKTLSTWNQTEGLAEFFLRQLLGETLPWSECQKYIDLYEKWWNEGCRSTVELYRKAIESTV